MNRALEREAKVPSGTDRKTYGEFLLTVLALLAGIVPIFMILIGPVVAMARRNPEISSTELMGMMANMPPSQQEMMALMQETHAVVVGYMWFALLPALVVLIAIAAYARRRYPRLYNRIAWGLWAGAIATFALEFVRAPGVLAGAFPGDMPAMFGRMIVGQEGVSAFLAGYPYHFLNGATFVLMYTLLFGKVRWYWGIAWGLFFELGMMVSPPVLMAAGPFGVGGYWPWLLIVTFIAHVAFGAAFGLLTEKKIADRGGIFSTLKPKSEKQEKGRRPNG